MTVPIAEYSVCTAGCVLVLVVFKYPEVLNSTKALERQQVPATDTRAPTTLRGNTMAYTNTHNDTLHSRLHM